MTDLARAKELLCEGKDTCVLCRETEILRSSERGVKPLLSFLASGHSFRSWSAADRVVGAGAAHLYLLLGVSHVWAGVLSECAERILREGGVSVEYGILVPHIVNRAGNGVCPVEQAVKDVTSSEEALAKIREVLATLSTKK